MDEKAILAKILDMISDIVQELNKKIVRLEARVDELERSKEAAEGGQGGSTGSTGGSGPMAV
jgi:hypothetical protein